MTLDTTPETDIRALAETLARQVDAVENAAKGAARLAKDLLRAIEGQDAVKAAAALEKLEKSEVPALDVRAALEPIKRHLAEEDRRLKFYFGKQLREAAAKAGLEAAPLTSDPPEFRIGHLTALVDLSRRRASIRYARLEIDTVPASPEAVVDAVRKAQAWLESGTFDPDRWFDQLFEAYRVRLQRVGEPFGTRVDIVDLLPEIAFARQPERFREDPRRENFQPYERVQMAYDLARLRRAGRLARQGHRLALGSATGGSTKQKARVLYLEDDRGSGQYYLSLWFTREGAQ